MRILLLLALYNTRVRAELRSDPQTHGVLTLAVGEWKHALAVTTEQKVLWCRRITAASHVATTDRRTGMLSGDAAAAL